MEIFEKRRQKLWNHLKVWFPVLLLVFICIGFLLGVNTTSEDALLKQQQTLLQALQKGAVHTYSLEGRYPESLEQLLEDYHITYDSSKFVVEYVPHGANLLPMISVLPLNQQKGGSK